MTTLLLTHIPAVQDCKVEMLGINVFNRKHIHKNHRKANCLLYYKFYFRQIVHFHNKRGIYSHMAGVNSLAVQISFANKTDQSFKI